MRLLFVVEHFHPFVGGVAVVFEELTKRLVRLGHEVHVVTTYLPKTLIEENWHGIIIHRVRTPAFSRRYLFTLLALPTIWRYALRADIIHTTTYNAAIPAWLVGKLLRKPVVISIHEVWDDRWYSYPVPKLLAHLYRWTEWAIVRLPYQQLVTISAATMKDLVRIRGNSEHCQMIHLGIDTTLFDPRKFPHLAAKKSIGFDGHFLFLYYGRPGISKGLEILLEAAIELRRHHPRARLLLLLNPDPRDRYQAIRQFIREHQLDDYVIIRPSVPRKELPQYIAAADCIVVPSLAEGFGFSAVEACTMGRPLVTTTAGSLPEVVWGETLLVSPGDPAALLDAMQQAMRHELPQLPPKVFSWEITTEKYLAIYRRFA